jgi:hypothetical protein
LLAVSSGSNLMKPMASSRFTLHRKTLIAFAIAILALTSIALVCLSPHLGWEWYKKAYFRARKREIVALVAEHAPLDTSIAISQAHIRNSVTGDWFWIDFTLILQTKEDLPDSFDLHEVPKGETPSIQRVSCRIPEKLRDENAGVSAYKLECSSWARCWALICIPIDQDF